MSSRNFVRTLIPLFVTFALAACGGSEPPAETAQSKAPVEHAAPPEHEAPGPSKEEPTEGKKSSEKSEAKGEKKSEESAAEVKRTPKDVLMMPGMLFLR